MPLVTFDVSKGVLALEDLFTYCEARRNISPQYRGVHDGLVYEAYNRARKYRLRYNRKTNTMRDDRLGLLSYPVNPSDWPEADADMALEELMREIWCDAVRVYNVADAA